MSSQQPDATRHHDSGATTALLGPEPAAAQQAPVLVATGLTKAYGDTVAIADVALTVQPGRVVGLLGANGAGKTTTINCVVGLLTPDEGSIEVCGLHVGDDQPRVRRMLGLAGQEVALYPELTARTNLRFFGELAGLSRTEVDDSIKDLSATLDIAALLDRRVRTLSGGQRQLVHVACGFVHRPALILLDEPSVGLDLSARFQFLAALRAIAGGGTSVLFSSHYLAEVEQVSDDVVILHKGRVIAAGPLSDLVDTYGESFVEVSAGGVRARVPGTDVAGVLSDLDNREQLESISVLRPSLESVFLSLTGIRLSEGSPTP